MPEYKHGKQTTPIELTTFKEAMENGRFTQPSHRSFLAFLYWFGVGRGEALECTPKDFKIKDSLLIVNAQPRREDRENP